MIQKISIRVTNGKIESLSFFCALYSNMNKVPEEHSVAETGDFE